MPVPLARLVWDEFPAVATWSEEEAVETYRGLQGLADRGQLAVAIGPFRNIKQWNCISPSFHTNTLHKFSQFKTLCNRYL